MCVCVVLFLFGVLLSFVVHCASMIYIYIYRTCTCIQSATFLD